MKTVSRFCAVTLDTLLYSNVFRVILVEIRSKYARIRPLSLFFYIFLQIFPFYIFRARSTAGEGGTEKYRPRISPLHDFLVAGMDSFI